MADKREQRRECMRIVLIDSSQFLRKQLLTDPGTVSQTVAMEGIT